MSSCSHLDLLKVEDDSADEVCCDKGWSIFFSVSVYSVWPKFSLMQWICSVQGDYTVKLACLLAAGWAQIPWSLIHANIETYTKDLFVPLITTPSQERRKKKKDSSAFLSCTFLLVRE